MTPHAGPLIDTSHHSKCCVLRCNSRLDPHETSTAIVLLGRRCLHIEFGHLGWMNMHTSLRDALN
jgi:hypothetical protein